jgi:tetratricopeptide (TPR) repeat protein
VADAASTLPVLDSVFAFIEQSLLRQVAGAGEEPRYQMLETVREFGLEQLTVTGEAEEARQRHADYFLSIAEHLQHGIRMTDDLTGLALERDNVLLALNWFDERGNAEALLRLSGLLYGVWFAPSLQREGWQWIDRALKRSSTAASAPRVLALATAGNLALFQWDYARAETYITEGLALSRTLGDPLLVGGALHMAGLLSYRRGEYGQAEALLDEALRVLRGLGDSVPDAPRDEGLALLVLGHTALAQEQFERAAKQYHDSLARFQTGGFLWGPIDAMAGLAAVHYCSGNLAPAAAHYMESLDRARDRGIALLMASALIGLAAIAAAFEQPETGASLLGAAEGVLASPAAPIRPKDQPVRERGLAAMSGALGEEKLAAAREAGRALTIDQAVARARAVSQAVMPSHP